MATTSLREKLGVCQWFHFGASDDLERAARLANQLGVRHLRTGISWADFYRPGGREWYERQFAALADLELLVSVWHTPPSISEGGRCAAPPRRLQDYADFLDQVLDLWGERIAAIELWNEPNNRYKWDFPRFDPDWRKFSEMIGMAAYWMRQRGVPTVLGGMIPIDPAWLDALGRAGALEQIDIVAIHGFPDMWWPDRPNWDWYDHWHGWDAKLASIRRQAAGRPIWITETGLATWSFDDGSIGRERLQCRRLLEAAAAPAPRVYWYSLEDLDPEREAIEGFHVDENEYHLGLAAYRGTPKPAWEVMRRLLAGDDPPAEAALDGVAASASR